MKLGEKHCFCEKRRKSGNGYGGSISGRYDEGVFNVGY